MPCGSDQLHLIMSGHPPMQLPSFLGPFKPIPAATFAPSLAPAAAAASNSLHFTMQHQSQTEWCWAATSASIDAFYPTASPKSQCDVATGVLSKPCCASPGSPNCNKQYALDIALGWVSHLAQPVIRTSLSLAHVAGAPSVQDQIDQGRPVCCFIYWSGGRGHFNAIYGYDLNTQDVTVGDPLFSVHIVPYATLLAAYQGAGSWDASYLTQ